jgi:hypothetical protein
MTRSHRNWHFWGWVILVPFVVTLFVLGLAWRPEAVP